jgi:WD40 repeat protein
LASHSQDGVVRVWLAASGQQQAEASDRCPSSFPQSLAFVRDDAQLAIGCGDAAATGITLVDVKTGSVVLKIQQYEGSTTVAASRDGQHVVGADYNSRVRLWDLKTGQEQLVDDQRSKHVHTVGISADSRWLAASVQPTKVLVWDLGTGKVTAELPHGPVFAMSPDESTVATAGFDNQIKLWDITSGTLIKQVAVSDNAVGLAMAPGGNLLAAAIKGGQLTDFSRQTGKPVLETMVTGGDPSKLAFSDDGRLLAVVQDAARAIHIWDIPSRQKLHSLAQAFQYNCQQLAFRPGTHELLSGSFATGAGRRWDCDTGQQIQQLPDFTVHRVAWSPDGAHFATTYWTTLRIWDASGKELAKYDLGPINANAMLAFAPDGRHVVVGNGNGTIYILRIPSFSSASAALTADPSTWSAGAVEPETAGAAKTSGN